MPRKAPLEAVAERHFRLRGIFGQKLSGVTAKNSKKRKRLPVGVFGLFEKRPFSENGQKLSNVTNLLISIN